MARRRREDEDPDERPKRGTRTPDRDGRSSVHSTRRAIEPPAALPEDESDTDAPIRVIKRQGPNDQRASESQDATDRLLRAGKGKRISTSVETSRNTLGGHPREGRDVNHSPDRGSRERTGLSSARGEGSTEGQLGPDIAVRNKGKHSIVRANGIGRMRVGW